jgi:hypothetical protein
MVEISGRYAWNFHHILNTPPPHFGGGAGLALSAIEVVGAIIWSIAKFTLIE